MMKLVRPFIRLSIAFWMRTSVRVSTELVASSRIRILGSARIARAMVRSCFCPWETLLASSFSSILIAAGQRLDEVMDMGGLGRVR